MPKLTQLNNSHFDLMKPGVRLRIVRGAKDTFSVEGEFLEFADNFQETMHIQVPGGQLLIKVWDEKEGKALVNIFQVSRTALDRASRFPVGLAFKVPSGPSNTRPQGRKFWTRNRCYYDASYGREVDASWLEEYPWEDVEILPPVTELEDA